jgi:GlcNAc-P-P-Und epimerase
MRFLVTGSSGYVGRFLVPRLQDSGAHVIGIDRRPSDGPAPDEFVQADLMDDAEYSAALTRVDRVVHLAAARVDWGVSAEGYLRDNALATERLIEVGVKAGIDDWVFYSSVSVHAANDTPLGEDEGLHPEGIYGKSKARAEAAFRRLSSSDPGQRVTVIRPSAIFGPGHPPDTNVYRLIEAVKAKRFFMVGDGSTPKSLTYMENLIDATFFLMDRPDREGFREYIVVEGPVMSTRDIVQTIQKGLSSHGRIPRIPAAVASLVGFAGDVAGALLKIDVPVNRDRIRKFRRPTNYSSRRLREEGFEFRVDQRDALHRTSEWHRMRDV